MLQYKTLLAESKTPLLLAQKEIASLQKELDAFRKAVDAKAKEKDAMEREAKFAKAETEKVWERRPCAVDASLASRPGDASAGPRTAPNRLEIEKQTTHVHHSRRRRPATVCIDAGRAADWSSRNAREGAGAHRLLAGGRAGDLQERNNEAAQADLSVGEGEGKVRRRGGGTAEPLRSPRLEVFLHLMRLVARNDGRGWFQFRF